MNEISDNNLLLWIMLISTILIQASWIFYDASKRGENKWIWGLLGCINVPTSLLIYLLVTRHMMKTANCQHCGRNIKINSNYCSHCGEKIKY